MFFQVLDPFPGNFRCRYRPRFNNRSFWQKDFSEYLPQSLSWSSQAVKAQEAVMEDACSRQLWRLSLQGTRGSTWGTGTHVKLQLKGALSLSTEVLSPSGDFPTGFHCAWPWLVLLRTQPESREPAEPDPADISFWAESPPTTARGFRGRLHRVGYNAGFKTGTAGRQAPTRHPHNSYPLPETANC